MSLRLRLLLAVGAVALVALLAADIATYQAFRGFLYERIDESLNRGGSGLEHFLLGGSDGGRGGGPDGGGGPGGPPREDVGNVAPGTFAAVRDANGRVVGEAIPAIVQGGEQWTPKLPARIDIPASESGVMPATYFTTDAVEDGGPRFRVRASSLGEGLELVIAIPLLETIGSLHRLVLIEFAVTAAALLAAGALGWWVVRVGLRPLDQVEDTAVAIAGGELDRRVPGEDAKTEVGRVAKALNTMLTRIQEAFAARDATERQLRRSEERLRRFVADASHELRTPVAAVSAYAELFERGAGQRPEDLARVMKGIRGETGRMARLVDDLLLLARLDEGRPLEHKSVELVSLTAQAADAARAVSPDWPIQVSAEQPVEVVGDGPRLRQVLDNLLANVRAHTPAGTVTTVKLRQQEAHAIIEVKDNGPGMAPEDAARVFERFYRADPSRSRAHGGSGLGLSIVSAIVTALGGDVTVDSEVGKGTAFMVTLPVEPLPDGQQDPDPEGDMGVAARPSPRHL
jgi:two-component system, OmpR family, sensor kinase